METPSSVWKHHRVYGNTHRACGNTHRACGNIIERGETLVSRGETHIERGETWGCTEALPKAKRRGVFWGSLCPNQPRNEIYLLNNKIHKNKYESVIGKCR